MAYFPDRSKESAGKLLAREIHTNAPLMAELSKTAYSSQRNSSPQNKSKSSSPSSASLDFQQEAHDAMSWASSFSKIFA